MEEIVAFMDEKCVVLLFYGSDFMEDNVCVMDENVSFMDENDSFMENKC